jgi:stringent starvation protein B
LGNEFIEFKARFGGKPREIMVPMNRVMAIYARENGQGMAFPVNRAERVLKPSDLPAPSAEEPANVIGLAAVPKAAEPESVTNSSAVPRPTLTRIK